MIHWNLEKPNNLKSVGPLPKFHIVIHLACRVGWDGSLLNEMFVPNIIATRIIAEMAQKHGAFFIFSSAAIVHGSKTEMITPKSPLHCDTPYAESKIMAENEIEKILREFCILRFGGIFGRNGPSHLGLNRAIENILAGKNPSYIGSGSARRNYISVHDAAKVIASICENRIRGRHLCAGHSSLSIKTMLEEACRLLNPLKCSPQQKEGLEARDQIIEVSNHLPQSGTFQHAMRELVL